MICLIGVGADAEYVDLTLECPICKATCHTYADPRPCRLCGAILQQKFRAVTMEYINENVDGITIPVGYLRVVDEIPKGAAVICER